ncbi:MAG: cytochrome c3 family protein [Bacteroidota bacterium]
MKKSGLFNALLALLLFVLVASPVAYAQTDGATADTATVSATAVDNTAAGTTPAASSPSGALDPAQVAIGKDLFTNYCAQCHAVTADVVVGPGLKGVSERRPEAWLLSWIKNSGAVKKSGDAYAVEITKKFNGTEMPSFPFTDDQIRGILAYVKSSEVAPAATTIVGPNPTPTNTVPSDGISSNLFIIVVSVLLVVLLLVLIVLVMVVSMLTKVANNQALSGISGQDEYGKADIGKVTRSTAFKAGAAILFILIAGKASIDGMYDVGIQQGYAPTQPIAFSHKLHAGQYQIQCRYCHTGVNISKHANIPSANICMNCHNAIKRESPEIQKIYTAIEKDQPIEWVRVHNLPDLAYFNHSQHVNVGGVACQQCHGEIEKMEVVQQRSSLTMGWCIDCHRKTNVNAAGNAYYDKLVSLHNSHSKEPLKVQNIGGLECSKCHY